jgi:uncharacterized damage-inducible protein DinB
MDAVLPYRAMAYNNGWANHRLLGACERLSQAEFTARRTGFFPSLRATLNHILIIDRFYIDAMEGGTLGPAAWADQEPCETVVQLRDAQSEMDRRLIAVVERLDIAGAPPQLDEFFAAGEAPLRAGEFAELGWIEETVWEPRAG